MATNRLTLLACAITVSAPLAAAAQSALTTGWVNLRAGPAPEYPLVVQLPPHASVSVLGCLSNHTWCDVLAPGNWRGWAYAGGLIYQDNGGPVVILNAGPSLPLPIVNFTLGAYWGDYYRERPWYRDRDRWESWHRQHDHRPDVRPPHDRSDVRPERPIRPSYESVRPEPPREVRPPVERPHADRPLPRLPSEVRSPDAGRGETRPVPRPPTEVHRPAARDDRGELRVPEAPR